MIPVAPAFLQNIGMPELVIILLIVLLVFGSRLPETARSLGKSISEFKKGVKEGENEAKLAEKQAEKPAESKESETKKA